MTSVRTFLEKCRALEKAATGGEWTYRKNPMRDDGYFAYGPDGNTLSFAQIPEGDAAFIAASRTAVPKLVEMLEVANTRLMEIAKSCSGPDQKFELENRCIANNALSELEALAKVLIELRRQ